MITFQTVLLLKNIELISQWKVEHYQPGEVEMPSDLAKLCIRNKWAVPVKVFSTPNQKNNY